MPTNRAHRRTRFVHDTAARPGFVLACALQCLGACGGLSAKSKNQSRLHVSMPLSESPSPVLPVLDVQNFSLRFSKDDSIPSLVDDVSFSVHRGETLCIVGESGCGKSVTSLAVMGLLPRPPARVTSGTARFGGKDLFSLDQRALADIRGNRISMIFQEPMTSLNPAYTIGEQIAECVLRHQTVNHASARLKALQMLEKVGIPAPEKRYGAN